MEPLRPLPQQLLDALTDEAREELKETGEGWPFGLGIMPDGTLAKIVSRYYAESNRERVMDDIIDILARMIPERGFLPWGPLRRGPL